MKKLAYCLVAIVLLVLLDQAGKAFAETCLPPFDGNAFWHDGRMFGLAVTHNTAPTDIVALQTALGIWAIALVWTMNVPNSCSSLLTAGGVGNIGELALKGSNVDYIVIRSGYDTMYVYNLSDFYLFAGVALIIVFLLLRKTKPWDLAFGSRFFDYGEIFKGR